MITRKLSNLFTALVLLLGLTFASACSKDSSTNQGASDKTESGIPTPDNNGDLSKLTDLLRPDQVALLERGPAVPGVDQLPQLVPPGTRLQMSVDFRPLQRSGLSKQIMEVVPSDSLTEYREWIRDTGFNPMEQAVAGAVWADTDDYKAFAHVGTSSRAVIVLNNAPLLDLLKKSMESPDDDEESERKEGEFAVFAPLSPPVLESISEMIQRDETTIYQRKLGSQVLLGVFGDAKKVGYIYAYPKGILLGMMVASDDKLFSTAINKLYSFAKALDNAAISGSNNDDERHAAFMRIPYPEGDATVTLDVTDNDVVTAMRFPYGMVGGQEGMQAAADNIWLLRSNAKQLTQEMIQKQGIPSKFGPLIELVLKKINIKTGPSSVLLEMSLSLDDVSELLDAI